MADDRFLVQSVLQNVAATNSCARLIAQELKLGDFIALAGALGAGKTTLARQIINELVPNEDVPSPTFTLVQAYDGPQFRLYHADLYRIKAQREVIELGFDESLDDGVLIVEWPDRMGSMMPKDRLDVILEVDDGVEERRVKLIGRGSWAERLRQLLRKGRLV